MLTQLGYNGLASDICGKGARATHPKDASALAEKLNQTGRSCANGSGLVSMRSGKMS